ncbi:MAG: M20/M25/M40 family metallo-hydrolase [Deltaproteobacteria bacterium]|nr:M20/M25/M40 family metallo-hydrolase [Deltaproteobacteria bacterium]
MALLCSSWNIACATQPSAEPVPKPLDDTISPPDLPLVEKRPPAPFPENALEPGLDDLVQLTFGGENAEAYWSFDGRQLVMQSRFEGMGCDRIVRMDAVAGLPTIRPVSNGFGATTCSFFLPGDQEVVFASTHLGAKECPPRPDMSLGYVWALYDSYDIFRATADGSNLRRLTETKGYDAEATVCKVDGSIVFTSVRDGDIDLYRMDSDGGNVVRLTDSPGYDGGAFFSDDCKRLVWRASRPRPGSELEEFRSLLGRGLVRPSRLELFVANADGSDPVQLTYLDAATFAPYFVPGNRKVIFSSNFGDPKGREFELWTIDVDGTNLTRVTHSPGFDGFPMFSPDGTRLVFASNRATPPGRSDTNVFVAHWNAGVQTSSTSSMGPAERIRDDVAWLADPLREGRGVGTKGLEKAGEWLERQFERIGLKPAGQRGFRHTFEVVTRLRSGPRTSMRLDGKKSDEFSALGFSKVGRARGELVLAGYGVSDEALGVDDYAGLDVKGRVVVVRRFVPEGAPFDSTDKKRKHGDIRLKAWTAKERGAVALIVVDNPVSTSTSAKLPDEARLPALEPEGSQDAGIVVVAAKRAELTPLWPKLENGMRVTADIYVDLIAERARAFNVVGKIESNKPGPALVIGAHYDHLGYGGRGSLAPDKTEPHLGADDNASGTATLLEIARQLTIEKSELNRDVVFVAFSAEENGVLGSTHLVRNPPKGLAPKELTAMLNLDMVGRLRNNSLSVLGGESAEEWPALVGDACTSAGLTCATSGDGYGPSDHTSFYAAGAPVLHFFTGAHNDYHKPSDRPELINAIGAAKIAEVVSKVALSTVRRGAPLTYRNVPSPAPRGDLRTFNASLGTVPNYVGPPGGAKGVLLDGVRPGGAAEQGGLRRGDVLIKLGTHEIGNVSDLMFVLEASKPGETVTAVVLRNGARVSLEVTFQESKRAK